MHLSEERPGVKRFSGKKIILGVTGSIASYKAAELTRRLRDEEACVTAVMTESATQFLNPLTLETLSGNKVAIELFPAERKKNPEHISLAQWADLLLIAPATANIIGKVASGIADDLLSTLIMAADSPVIFAPAMNSRMFKNKALQKNIRKLKGFGYEFIEPGSGYLACGEMGKGRLAETEEILDACASLVNRFSQLSGKRILITAGRTEEDLDPVRFLTNRSSGKTGYAIAEEAKRRGARVTLISGPTWLSPPIGIQFEQVRTTEQMRQKVQEFFPKSDALIMAAAVSDFRPKAKIISKIKKGQNINLQLENTPDILSEVAFKKVDKLVVGFALETEENLKEARRKLKEKNLDLIVLNTPRGFGGETNSVTIIEENGNQYKLPELPKKEIAVKIFDILAKKWNLNS